MENLSLVRANIRHGHAPVRLPVLGHTVHAVQESFYVLNAMQLTSVEKAIAVFIDTYFCILKIPISHNL